MENTGCAPFYRKYDLALQLASGATAFTMKTNADVIKWLPGDTFVDGGVFVPSDLPTGKYSLRLAMLDRLSGLPKIQFANKGRAADGWYDLGVIEVVPTDKYVQQYFDPFLMYGRFGL